MIVCPLCEHSQETGDTCDVCGKRLTFEPPTSAQYPPIPDLEVTTLAGAAAGIPFAPMPDLEVHHADAVQVTLEVVPDIEATQLAGVDAQVVAQETVPDVERTRFEDAAPRTVLGEMITCRYCGQSQKRENRLCERCANALPVVRPDEPVKAVANVRCPSCGFESQPKQACPACGYFLREE
jgi:ribosomal protein L32